jgi:hypothetical protein
LYAFPFLSEVGRPSCHVQGEEGERGGFIINFNKLEQGKRKEEKKKKRKKITI